MTDTLAALVLVYGLWLIGGVTFFSCLALPVPASLIMVTGGAFAAAGDISLPAVLAAAYVGANAGDQIGYTIGRRGGTVFAGIMNSRSTGKAMFQRACDFSRNWGKSSVFLSRWLVSPLGPYLNILSGASGMRWLVFTAFAAAGEAIWVSLYVGLGFVFTDRIGMIADLAGTVSGLLAAVALSALFAIAALRPAARPAGSAATNRNRQKPTSLA